MKTRKTERSSPSFRLDIYTTYYNSVVLSACDVCLYLPFLLEQFFITINATLIKRCILKGNFWIISFVFHNWYYKLNTIYNGDCVCVNIHIDDCVIDSHTFVIRNLLNNIRRKYYYPLHYIRMDWRMMTIISQNPCKHIV